MPIHLDDTVMKCLTGSEKAEKEAALLKKSQLSPGEVNAVRKRVKGTPP